MFQAYLITCSVNERRYVGITARTLSRRWKEHVADAMRRPSGRPLYYAIRKYGPEAFSITSLFVAASYEGLLSAERELIAQLGTLAPDGYNLSPGGEGCLGIKRSAETRRLISAAKLGKPRTAETRALLSRAKMGISQNVGESNGGAKLTAQHVREARARLAAGESQRSIARSFGIHYNAIWKIANGLKWRSVA